MRRRDFIAAVAGTAAAWPVVARTQQPAPLIGFLTTLGRNDRPNLAEAARRGLSETGYVEGHIVAIEYRFAEDHVDRLPALAADLVGRKVAVILAAGGGASVLAAKAVTTTIPIVFLTGGDPVRQGYVVSLNRPGTNMTGVNWFGTQLAGKGLGLLHELVPAVASIALLANPNLPEAARFIADAQQAAHTFGLRLIVLDARTPSEISTAFTTMRQQGAGALLVSVDPFFSSRRQQIVVLVGRDALPTMYFNREFVTEGGLMSYGNDVSDAYRRAGVYIGRILNGALPGSLPVDQATKFEFVINLKTAKTLGVKFSDNLMSLADEVIE